MRSWKSFAILCTAAFGVAGCKGDAKSYDAVGSVAEIVDALCERSFSCCDDGENAFVLGPYVTADNCSEHLVQEAELGYYGWNYIETPMGAIAIPNLAVLDRLAAEGQIRIDRDAREACVEYIRQLECPAPTEEPAPIEGCDPTIEEDVEYPCDPEQLIDGLVGEGEPCDDAIEGLECDEGLRCILSDTSILSKDLGANGTCEQPRQLDETCRANYHCADDLYCSQLTGTCQVPRALGEECQYSPIADTMAYPDSGLVLIACQDGLTCSPFTSTCVGLCEEGTRCWSNNDVYCDDKDGLVCVYSSWQGRGHCDQPRADGGACFEDADCAAGFGCELTDVSQPGACVALTASGLACVAHDECASGFCSAISGNCEDRLDAGVDCPTTLHEQCVEGAYCYSSDAGNTDPYTCVDLVADGQPCSFDYECASEACVLGACVSLPLADGDECESDFQCESDQCNTAASTPTCVAEGSLANGADCDVNAICASRVCFENACEDGAAEGADCGLALLPCDPVTTFCDLEADAPKCTVFTEGGEDCARDLECRSGECTQRWNRWMCEPAAPPDEYMCGAGVAVVVAI